MKLKYQIRILAVIVVCNFLNCILSCIKDNTSAALGWSCATFWSALFLMNLYLTKE